MKILKINLQAWEYTPTSPVYKYCVYWFEHIEYNSSVKHKTFALKSDVKKFVKKLKACKYNLVVCITQEITSRNFFKQSATVKPVKGLKR